MPEPVIIEAVRIPFGKRSGLYRETRPDALLAHTLCGLVERVGIDLPQIEDIIAGCVTQAGEQGANIGRLAALLAGFPVEVPGVSLDRMCGSSQQAVHFAAQSHRRANQASDAGWHKELIPVTGLDVEGQAVAVTRDEGIRPVIDMAKMAALPAVFRPDGRGGITAGNASQITDGAAAVLVADRETAEADGFQPRARFLARVVVGSDPTLQLEGVIPATYKALERAGLALDDIDWVEINEAFASVVLAWGCEFQPNMDKVNPWGGAIAHGHPLGATGAGLMAKMLAGLEMTGGQIGLQVMCIGHGMSTASVVQRI